MTKQVLIIGFIVLFMSVGLSGCNDNSDTGIISFQQLLNNSTKYFGQNITMKGYIGETIANESGGPYIAYFYDSSSNAQYVLVAKVPSDIELHIGMYKITATVVNAIYATPKLTIISAVPL
jgi:hypothetical protein